MTVEPRPRLVLGFSGSGFWLKDTAESTLFESESESSGILFYENFKLVRYFEFHFVRSVVSSYFYSPEFYQGGD